MEIRINGLSRHYYSDNKLIKALNQVNLTIPANKIFTLLGPSGCGKTTLLRSIVGLEMPDFGEIYIGDELVWSSEKKVFVPPEKRGLGMVFQTYAIWPHMNVFNNVAYPLQTLGVSQGEIRKKVSKVLEFVQLSGFENRPATKLSGGQQQRVALARALVAEPKVILFDEPLSNLDAKLREETRKELRAFLTELEITAVYVTHDRVEALALSDMIAVMREGQIIETGEPQKIYFNSDHRFVADFIGRANLINGKIVENIGPHAALMTSLGTVKALNSHGFVVGQEVIICVRPEFIKLSGQSNAASANTFNGNIESLIFIGEAYESEIRIGDNLLTTTIEPSEKLFEGDPISISFDPEHCFLISA